MSSFCVFGVSLSDCRIAAEGKVNSYDKQLKRHLTVSEFSERVEKLAQEMFATFKTAKQISPEFDAPQFCLDWISVARRTAKIEGARIMSRPPKFDSGANIKSRKWVPYTA